MGLVLSTIGICDVIQIMETRGIEHGAYWQRAGTITFKLNAGFDFSMAAPDTPVYMRCRFYPDITLSQTLVDIESADAPHSPIRLAVFVIGSEEDKIVAPENAIEIVRWRAGESQFWLRINAQPMLERNSAVVAPDDRVRVGFVIGNTKRESIESVSQHYETDRANLRSNCLSDGTPMHTMILLNSFQVMILKGTTIVFSTN